MMGNTICALADAAAMPTQRVRHQVPRRVRASTRALGRCPLQPSRGAEPQSRALSPCPRSRSTAGSVEVEDGLTVIQAAERLGIEIPHYCWHPGSAIAGNCRMCLVEIEKVPKLQIACNTRVTDGMVVHTKSDARPGRRSKAVLEFLLINHPIDCPICDQAGECKLQEYYMDYDRQQSRVSAVGEGPQAEGDRRSARTSMLDQERCILCSRCTRFLDEVTKTSELGVFERGDHAEHRPRARQAARQPVLGQRRRHLSGRRAHQPRLPLPRPRLVPANAPSRSAPAAPTAATSRSTTARDGSSASSRATTPT